MSDLGFYVPSALGALAFLARVPALIRDPRDPLLWSVAVLLSTASGVFFFGAIPTISKLNELSGIPNFSAPVVYTLLTAFSGSCVVLMINWRGGPPEWTRRATRLSIATYGMVCVVLIALFSLADAPVERLRDLDTYYANTPYMREMIVLYLLAHAASAVIMTVICRRWSREITGILQAGMVFLTVGYLITIFYDVSKFAAVGACWAGIDWDGLSTDVARPAASVASLFIACGFVLPLIGQLLEGPVHAWRKCRLLRPLWRLTREVPGSGEARDIPLLTSPGLKALHLERDIHDCLLTLNPYLDFTLRAERRHQALARGAGAPEADAAADAAMIVSALAAFRADPERHVIASSRALQGTADERRDLVRIAQAVRHVPLDTAPRPTPRG